MILDIRPSGSFTLQREPEEFKNQKQGVGNNFERKIFFET